MDNVQTPGGNTTTAGAVEQLYRAQKIAARIAGPALTEQNRLATEAALAAIIETTEAAAKLTETWGDTRLVYGVAHNTRAAIATALRNNDHLKGPKP